MSDFAPLLVTIDGPSGSGKSTISRGIAARLGLRYLDTGAMYRAVALRLSRDGISLEDESALRKSLDRIELSLLPKEGDDIRVLLDGEDVSQAIRTPEMALEASRVSAHPLVREKLTALQRRQAESGGLVAEGRDMGTVVFPAAQFKFFLDASPEERARRRRLQLKERGELVSFEEILRQIKKRDQADSSRALAPLIPAADALVVDCSQMNPTEVIDLMLDQIRLSSDSSHD